ncbi:hypothetical protein F5Y17DRAFT_463385 [Xylariaceae sp. FL0594]|nr:hypothetical protein F5Y17DRAFT_463385 [Xylariaceae sp. FL0594]
MSLPGDGDPAPPAIDNPALFYQFVWNELSTQIDSFNRIIRIPTSMFNQLDDEGRHNLLGEVVEYVTDAYEPTRIYLGNPDHMQAALGGAVIMFRPGRAFRAIFTPRPEELAQRRFAQQQLAMYPGAAQYPGPGPAGGMAAPAVAGGAGTPLAQPAASAAFYPAGPAAAFAPAGPAAAFSPAGPAAAIRQPRRSTGRTANRRPRRSTPADDDDPPPKKPPNHRILGAEDPQLGLSKKSELSAVVWHVMTDAEKEPWVRRAAQEGQKYKVEMAAWKERHRDPAATQTQEQQHQQQNQETEHSAGGGASAEANEYLEDAEDDGTVVDDANEDLDAEHDGIPDNGYNGDPNQYFGDGNQSGGYQY